MGRPRRVLDACRPAGGRAHCLRFANPAEATWGPEAQRRGNAGDRSQKRNTKLIRALFERQTAVPKRSKRRPRDAQEEVRKSQTFPKWSPQSGPCILVSLLFGNLVGIADLNPDLHICLDGGCGRQEWTRTADADRGCGRGQTDGRTAKPNCQP